MSSTDSASNRLLNLRNLVILLVGLAMATGTARFAHLRVGGASGSPDLLGQQMSIHVVLGWPETARHRYIGLMLTGVEVSPELTRFVDGLSERFLLLVPGESRFHTVWTCDPESSQGWPLASRRSAYNIRSFMASDGRNFKLGPSVYADRNGLDPFSLLGFLGNVLIHAIPLTLLVAGLSWWVRSWRAKQRARRRGFPVVPLDAEA